jgi:hypothetical protein
MQINEWGKNYMQIIRNLRHKRIKVTQIKFDGPRQFQHYEMKMNKIRKGVLHTTNG